MSDYPSGSGGECGSIIDRCSTPRSDEQKLGRTLSISIGTFMVSQLDLPGTEPADYRGGAPIADAGLMVSNGLGPKVIDAATLSGESVVNRANEDLGRIDAIMLDVTCGRIAYAVLSSGGFLGMGRKLVVVPWGALTMDAGKKRFILDASKEKLGNAEGFDKDHWPSMADPAWAFRLHSYYDVAPYWNEGGVSEEPAGLRTEAARPIAADTVTSSH